MKTLITDIIKMINLGSTASEVNTKFVQYCSDFNQTSVDEVAKAKIEIVKRYYFYKMELDTPYGGLYFQADEITRSSVITPRATMALQSIVEGDNSWVGLIVSNTKDDSGHDIPKQFTAAELLEFANIVTSDVENYFIQRKNHCNNIEDVSDPQEILDYDFTEIV